MENIIIYTTPEKLLHKQDKLEGDKDKSKEGIYYWQLKNIPKKLKLGGKVYFATKGFIRGYFKILWINSEHKEHDFDRDPLGMPDNSFSFFSKSWKNIKPIPTKSFQGFKYANKVEELS